MSAFVPMKGLPDFYWKDRKEKDGDKSIKVEGTKVVGKKIDSGDIVYLGRKISVRYQDPKNCVAPLLLKICAWHLTSKSVNCLSGSYCNRLIITPFSDSEYTGVFCLKISSFICFLRFSSV